jgi:outer membrane PBP1 activator LpoA protein
MRKLLLPILALGLLAAGCGSHSSSGLPSVLSAPAAQSPARAAYAAYLNQSDADNLGITGNFKQTSAVMLAACLMFENGDSPATVLTTAASDTLGRNQNAQDQVEIMVVAAAKDLCPAYFKAVRAYVQSYGAP